MIRAELFFNLFLFTLFKCTQLLLQDFEKRIAEHFKDSTPSFRKRSNFSTRFLYLFTQKRWKMATIQASYFSKGGVECISMSVCSHGVLYRLLFRDVGAFWDDKGFPKNQVNTGQAAAPESYLFRPSFQSVLSLLFIFFLTFSHFFPSLVSFPNLVLFFF